MARFVTFDDEPPVTTALVDQVRDFARPLRGDLSPLLRRVGDARLALLGEASHGTSDYYRLRCELTRELVEEKGFRFVAVEGDWPDCYRINRYVKGYPESGASAREVLSVLDRWPTWMWANEEIVDLVEWLRQYNGDLPAERRVGFYGLDVYSLFDSLRILLDHLGRRDPAAARAARQVAQCFEPYGEDAQDYARATVWEGVTCKEEVADLIRRLEEASAPRLEDAEAEANFVLKQNAHVVKGAEQYYRTMVRSDETSWNIRDRHMIDTLSRLLAFHGDDAKAVVWEHNTHIGDARFTDMTTRGEVNVGQLARERWGDDGTVLVGFGCDQGTVVAGREWDAPREVMAVPPGRPGSWEAVLHQATGGKDALLLFDEMKPTEEVLEERGHRAIGVVYRPRLEAYGNYVPTVLPRRYDAFVYVDRTRALHPLLAR